MLTPRLVRLTEPIHGLVEAPGIIIAVGKSGTWYEIELPGVRKRISSFLRFVQRALHRGKPPGKRELCRIRKARPGLPAGTIVECLGQLGQDRFACKFVRSDPPPITSVLSLAELEPLGIVEEPPPKKEDDDAEDHGRGGEASEGSGG